MKKLIGLIVLIACLGIGLGLVVSMKPVSTVKPAAPAKSSALFPDGVPSAPATPQEQAIFAMQAEDKRIMEDPSATGARRRAASADAQQLVRLLVKVDRPTAGK